MNWRVHRAAIIRATEGLRELLFSYRRLTVLFFRIHVRPSDFHLGNWDLTTFALKNAIDKQVRNGQSVLEVGTGPFAILSIYIAKKKEIEVTAVDVSEDFIENAKKTAKYNGVSINFLESDLLSNVNDSFDIVFFNPPYLPREYARQIRRKKSSRCLRSIFNGGPNGCETIGRFLEQVSAVMHKNSKVLLGVNKWFVNAEKIKELIRENDLKLIYVYSSPWNPSQVYVIRNEKTTIHAC